ncbi:MAG: hypothetical protein ACXAD7_05325 [Candidatus Kariarchaeaceae archaeon]|jgi:hypothetical protein
MKVDLSNKLVKISIVYFLVLILFIVPNQSSSAYPILSDTSRIASEFTRTVDQSLGLISEESNDHMVIDDGMSTAIPKKPSVEGLAETEGILLLHSDRDVVADVESMFVDQKILTRDIDITQYVPTLQELLDFPLVFIWTYEAVESPGNIGDALADYVDAGGSVIMAAYAHSDPGLDIEGRFFDDAYSPFRKYGSADKEREYNRTSTHPIFENVERFASSLNSEPVGLDNGATLVAANYDGVPFVALKDQVIAINAYPNPNYLAGDFSQLFANAVNYLLADKVLLLYADHPSTAQSMSDLITPFGFQVDILDVLSEIPKLVNISDYSVIITWTNEAASADNDAWGDLMANYVESNGSLILLPYTYVVSPYALGGRFASEGYSPFEYVESTDIEGTYSQDTKHPIFDNVVDYKTLNAQPTDITKGTFPIAYYEKGTIFAALRGSVLGINSYIPFNLEGNVDQLLANAIDFLLSGVLDDDLAPSITVPTSNSMEEGTIGNYLSWTLNDVHPYDYELRVDGVVKSSGIYADGDKISISTNGLSLGEHTYRMAAFDQVGNSDIKYLTFTVIDSVAPEITTPSDIEMELGDTSKNITWVLTDNHPADYLLTYNGTEMDGDPWTSEEIITILLHELGVGNHTFEINVSDTSGNFAADSVLVVVLPLITPTVNRPADIYMFEGHVGHVIRWYVEDNDPDVYSIELDGEALRNDSWVAISTIEVSLAGYTSGYYNFTLILYDYSGNMVSDTVMVQVYPSSTTTGGSTAPSGGGSSGMPSIPREFIAIGAITTIGIGIFSLLFRRR